jgi:hypothetical protein
MLYLITNKVKLLFILKQSGKSDQITAENLCKMNYPIIWSTFTQMGLLWITFLNKTPRQLYIFFCINVSGIFNDQLVNN